MALLHRQRELPKSVQRREDLLHSHHHHPLEGPGHEHGHGPPVHHQLHQVQPKNININVKVNNRHGRCSLPIMFARMGRLEELEYVLDLSTDIDDKDDENRRE